MARAHLTKLLVRHSTAQSLHLTTSIISQECCSGPLPDLLDGNEINCFLLVGIAY